MDALASWLLSWGLPPDLAAVLHLDLLGQLVLAALLGGAIGFEREVQEKPAGLRTNILICVGAALFTYLSVEMAEQARPGTPADPARIAAQIVTGIGFLGAGAIIQARGHVMGMTTAATIWVVAGIGMAVGGGAYVEALGGTLLVLLVLTALRVVERGLEEGRTRLTVQVLLADEPGATERILAVLRERGVPVTLQAVRREEDGGGLEARLLTRTRRETFETLTAELLSLPEVREVELA